MPPPELNRPLLASSPSALLRSIRAILLTGGARVPHSHLLIRKQGQLEPILPLQVHMTLLVRLYVEKFVAGRDNSSIRHSLLLCNFCSKRGKNTYVRHRALKK